MNKIDIHLDVLSDFFQKENLNINELNSLKIYLYLKGYIKECPKKIKFNSKYIYSNVCEDVLNQNLDKISFNKAAIWKII
jgi:hypothetical protein